MSNEEKTPNLLKIMSTSHSVSDKAVRFFDVTKRNVHENQIRQIELEIQSKEDAINEIKEEMCLETDVNRGIQALSQKQIESKVLAIIELEEEIFLDKRKLKITTKSFNKLFN